MQSRAAAPLHGEPRPVRRHRLGDEAHRLKVVMGGDARRGGAVGGDEGSCPREPSMTGVAQPRNGRAIRHVRPMRANGKSTCEPIRLC